jgi:CspA family cold shock protein
LRTFVYPALHVAGGKPSLRFGAELSTKGTTIMATINGTVKFFNTTKGFGFITPDNGGKDHFVHISAVQRSGVDGLYENDKVTYEVETGRDGRESAINLTLVK